MEEVYGCFYNFGVLFAGVLIARALLSEVYWGPEFGEASLST